jgi:hypothetical protein
VGIGAVGDDEDHEKKSLQKESLLERPVDVRAGTSG